jgi:small subunit ribosomal protein SAe
MTSVPSGSKVLRATEGDMQKLLAARNHLGTKNVTDSMKRYVYARTKDGVHVIDMHTTWEKLLLAARIIVAIDNPADVAVCSTRLFGQRAIFKYGQYTGATYLAGRFIPGTFTNQIQSKFLQPRLLIVTDPRTDHQAINEARLVNIPVIAFCDTDAPTQFVDVVIPTNNRGREAIGMMYWLLAREVLRMRGTVARSVPWEVKVDLFFYRDPEEAAKNIEAQKQTAAKTETAQGYWAPEENQWENVNPL